MVFQGHKLVLCTASPVFHQVSHQQYSGTKGRTILWCFVCWQQLLAPSLHCPGPRAQRTVKLYLVNSAFSHVIVIVLFLLLFLVLFLVLILLLVVFLLLLLPLHLFLHLSLILFVHLALFLLLLLHLLQLLLLLLRLLQRLLTCFPQLFFPTEGGPEIPRCLVLSK